MAMDHADLNSEEATLALSIKMAWGAVEKSGIPSQVQDVAFTEVLRSLLGTRLRRDGSAEKHESQLSQTEITNEGIRVAHTKSPSNSPDDDVIQNVSTETGVAVDKLEQVFHVDDGVVKLIGQHTKYGSTAAERARTVAKIVTVVRKLGMRQNATPFDVLKDACESKHCLDSKNFASKHMQDIDGFVVKGEGRSRRLEVRSNGISDFSDIIEKVLGIV